MRDQLRALAKLAEIDGSARELDAELSALPKRIEAMRHDVQTLETLLSAERVQLTEAEALLTDRQSDLQQRNDALSRAKAKGGKARNLKEADAAEREVEAGRRGIKERQEELERIEGTIGKKRETLVEREKQFEESRTMFLAEEQASKERLVWLKAERERVVHGRDEQAAKLPAAIVKRYEKLRTRPKYSAVAVITEGTCVSCRMALPAQLYITIQKGEEFHECPQCRALIVHADLLS